MSDIREKRLFRLGIRETKPSEQINEGVEMNSIEVQTNFPYHEPEKHCFNYFERPLRRIAIRSSKHETFKSEDNLSFKRRSSSQYRQSLSPKTDLVYMKSITPVTFFPDFCGKRSTSVAKKVLNKPKLPSIIEFSMNTPKRKIRRGIGLSNHYKSHLSFSPLTIFKHRELPKLF